jgi:hydrogenase-4 component F
VYVPGYLAQHPERPNRIFCACVLAFMGVLTLITEAHHLGLMWVAMEASTLAAAPLLYFNRNPRSLEATWKYLLVGSVGIALALLGSFFLGYAALYTGREPSLLVADLVRNAPQMSRSWLHAAFVVLLVGYGTKMGLAPMHTWKPDAYGEAPGITGTLLAGGLTSGAFLAILRVYRICTAAGEAEFARKPLIALGLVSMLVAGVFMARQKDYKRMLAYSSVEHMGILVLGIGIGGSAVFGAMLHLLNNGLTKGVLFLSAANIHRAFGSKSTDQVTGALRRVPISAALLLAGFFAITGSPPFGPFLSEFTILNAAVSSGQFAVAILFLLMLIIVFIGMGATVLAVVQGDPGPVPGKPFARENALTVAPSICLLALVLLLGVYIPAPLDSLLRAAAASLDSQ